MTRGGRGVGKPPKHDYVIYEWSLRSDIMTKSAALIKGPVQGMAIPDTGILSYQDMDLQFQMLLNDLEPWTKYVLNYRVSKQCTHPG